MSEKLSRAEEAYLDGLEIWEIALRAGGAKGVQQRSIELFQEALNLGLDDPSTEVQCRLALGVELLDLYREQFQDLGKADLNSPNMKGVNEAVAMLESALRVDAEKGTRFLANRVAQSMVLLRLSAIWQTQSLFIKNQFGLDKKLQYLQEKQKLLKYLDGVEPSGFCNSFAFYYKDVDNKPLTLEWLKKGAESDVYEDIDGESSFYLMAAHSKQSCKKGVREMSTPARTSSKSAQKENKGGCFVATAVYGSPFAGEVMLFRQFRDEKLLPSKLGSMFVQIYYFVSPTVAKVISKSERLKAITRVIFLEPILRLIKK